MRSILMMTIKLNLFLVVMLLCPHMSFGQKPLEPKVLTNSSPFQAQWMVYKTIYDDELRDRTMDILKQDYQRIFNSSMPEEVKQRYKKQFNQLLEANKEGLASKFSCRLNYFSAGVFHYQLIYHQVTGQDSPVIEVSSAANDNRVFVTDHSTQKIEILNLQSVIYPSTSKAMFKHPYGFAGVPFFAFNLNKSQLSKINRSTLINESEASAEYELVGDAQVTKTTEVDDNTIKNFHKIYLKLSNPGTAIQAFRLYDQDSLVSEIVASLETDEELSFLPREATAKLYTPGGDSGEYRVYQSEVWTLISASENPPAESTKPVIKKGFQIIDKTGEKGQ